MGGGNEKEGVVSVVANIRKIKVDASNNISLGSLQILIGQPTYIIMLKSFVFYEAYDALNINENCVFRMDSIRLSR